MLYAVPIIPSRSIYFVDLPCFDIVSSLPFELSSLKNPQDVVITQSSVKVRFLRPSVRRQQIVTLFAANYHSFTRLELAQQVLQAFSSIRRREAHLEPYCKNPFLTGLLCMIDSSYAASFEEKLKKN